MKALILTIALSFAVLPGAAWAKCEVVKGGAKSDYTGEDLASNKLTVEKKSLATLNKEFPTLQVTQKVFTGQLVPCTDCSDNYVTCN